MYDIIGDVHGYATLLKKLLKKLGYEKNDASYSHTSKKAVFIGDFINRGPEVRETVQIVRSMVESGNAYAINGNHELNALIFYIRDKFGNPIMQKNITGFFNTQKSFVSYAEEWKNHRKWMRTLPLFLEFDQLRVVHACWKDENIDYLKNNLVAGLKLKKNFLTKIYQEPDSIEGKSIWQTTRGLFFDLPKDLSIRNNKKMSIRSFRMNWWDSSEGKTFDQLSFESKFRLPDYTVPVELMPKISPYPDEAPIVIFGHYCKGEGPYILKPNVCCIDSCVVGTRILSAYSWDGEDKLNPKHIVSIK
jgi:hypothetical protein